jgi:RNA recognition motif-containing protein
MNQQSQSRNPLSHLAFLTGLGSEINLPELVQCLKTKFTGIIAFSKLPKKRTGYTFIAFSRKELLDQFLAAREITFKDRKLSIKPYLTGDRLEQFKANLNNRRLFVNLIPLEWEDDHLNSFFSQFGEVESAYIIKERNTSVSKGFGYVITKDLSLADYLANINSFDLQNGDHMVVWKHKSRKQKSKKKESKHRKGGVEPKVSDFIFLQNSSNQTPKFKNIKCYTNRGNEDRNEFGSDAKPNRRKPKNNWKMASDRRINQMQQFEIGQYIKPTQSQYFFDEDRNESITFFHTNINLRFNHPNARKQLRNFSSSTRRPRTDQKYRVQRNRYRNDHRQQEINDWNINTYMKMRRSSNRNPQNEQFYGYDEQVHN